MHFFQDGPERLHIVVRPRPRVKPWHPPSGQQPRGGGAAGLRHSPEPTNFRGAHPPRSSPPDWPLICDSVLMSELWFDRKRTWTMSHSLAFALCVITLIPTAVRSQVPAAASLATHVQQLQA